MDRATSHASRKRARTELAVDALVDRLFYLAKPGTCNCWPECAMKYAKQDVRKFLRKVTR